MLPDSRGGVAGPQIISFGPFKLDVRSGELRKHGIRIRLHEQPFRLLLMLLSSPGDVVLRDEIRQALWPDNTVVEFDHGINATVQRLRDALGDSAGNPSYVETLPRRGYRFIGAVEHGASIPTSDAPPSRPEATEAGAVPNQDVNVPVRRRLLLAGILVIAVLSIAAWWASREFASLQPPRFERLSYRRGSIQAARFSPDGRSVIFAASWDGQPLEMYGTQLGTLDTRSLSGPSTGLFAIASTGRMAVSTNSKPLPWYSQVGTLAEMPLGGSAPREILDHVQFADWTKDATSMAVVVSDETGKRLEFPQGVVLFRCPDGAWIGDPRVSPSGERVAFVYHHYAGNDGAVMVIDSQGQRQTLTRAFDTLQGLAWSSSGKEIWFTASEGGAGQQSLRAVTLSGALRMVAQIPESLRLHDIAPDGRVLLSKEESRMRIYVMGPEDSVPRDLTWHDWAISPILSSDGKTLLMTGNDEASGGKSVVYMRGTDNSPAVRLGENLGVSLSPNGLWVATLKDLPEVPNIVLLPVKAGSPIAIEIGSLRLVKEGIPGITWHPDSERILFSAHEPGRPPRTFIRNIQDREDKPITPEGLHGRLLTSDGRSLLAYDSASNAFLVPLEGGEPKAFPLLTPEYSALIFSVDGRGIFVTKPSERPSKIYRMDLATGRKEVSRIIPAGDPTATVWPPSIRITPDGTSIAYSYRISLSELYLVHGLR